MPRTAPLGINHIPIDTEWAESLVGLRLIVPNSWWPDFHDDQLNPGRIASINADEPRAYYFEVQLDGADHCYGMLYKSVLLYADIEQPGFDRFRLPDHCPGNPDDEVVRVALPSRSSLMTTTTNTPTGAPPGKPNGTGIDENVANGAVDDSTDYDDDSDDYDEFGYTKKERAKGTTKKRKAGRQRQGRR